MDSVRRSSRANKGQNKRLENQILMEMEYTKKRDRSTSETSPKYKIRCSPCKTSETALDLPKECVQCTKCKSWQHLTCAFGQHASVHHVMDDYQCSRCSESEFTGEGEFTGDGEFTCEQLSDDEFDDDLSDEPTRDGADSVAVPRKRARKTLAKPTEHDKTRSNVRSMFTSLFSKFIIPETTRSGAYSGEDRSTELGDKLEQALYDAEFDRDTGLLSKYYRDKFTSLYSNLKDVKNLVLKEQVMKGELPFDRLVRLSVKELVNPQLREFQEKVEKEALEGLTFERAQGAQYKRTHRGDELIESDGYEEGDVFRVNLAQPQPVQPVVAAVQQSTEELQLHVANNADDERGTQLPIITTSAITDPANPDATLGLTHNDDDATHSATQLVTRRDNEDSPQGTIDEYDPLAPATHTDDEYDPLAPSIDTEDEYDPTSTFTESPSVTVNFDVTGNCTATLEYIASSSDLGRQLSTQLFSDTISVQGRLDRSRAEPYIHQVQPVRELIVFRVDSLDSNYESLFSYFAKRKKYGVLNSKQPYVKDCYLVPCEAGSAPSFFTYFRELDLDTAVPVRNNLFIVAVVKRELVV